MVARLTLASITLALTSSCSTLLLNDAPKSLGEESSGYTYIPIDPIAIAEKPGRSCGDETNASLEVREAYRVGQYGYRIGTVEPQRQPLDTIVYKPLLESFPDNAVRISVEQFDSKGNVSYGQSSIGAKNELYRVTVDYINADTRSFPISVRKTINGKPAKLSDAVEPSNNASYEVRTAKSVDFDANADEFETFNLPIYVGIGLRVTANVQVLEGNAKIEGLGVIGAEAEAGRLRGSLVVQTLGVNGKSISAALPIQSELNRTTAQNAIVSIGSIKALLYEDETVISPRVVGIYLPFPGGQALVNQIISELSKTSPIEWHRPCERAVDSAGRDIALEEPSPG